MNECKEITLKTGVNTGWKIISVIMQVFTIYRVCRNES